MKLWKKAGIGKLNCGSWVRKPKDTNRNRELHNEMFAPIFIGASECSLAPCKGATRNAGTTLTDTNWNTRPYLTSGDPHDAE